MVAAGFEGEAGGSRMRRQFDLIGFFDDEEECVRGIAVLKKTGLRPTHVFMPFPSDNIYEAMELPKSRIRAWVLEGGIAGVITGFVLTIGLSLEWPHNTGGKPIVSLPPFVIIAFELMILFGGLMGVVG